jgi:PKC-activated protein phosphatase-1 inhibitor.
MECGVSATYPSTNGGAPNGIMTDVRSERSPAKSGLHVNFSEKGEVKERREKFLTAKYGSHQMSLIRKRLAVEMWLYDELQKLYEPSVSAHLLCYLHTDFFCLLLCICVIVCI